MRQSLNAGITGSEFLDFVLLGIVIAVAGQALFSVLGGKIPGPNIVPAAVGGAIVAAIVYVFKSGMGF